MTHDLILKNIAKHILLDQDEIAHFLLFLKQKKIAKKEYLLKEGQICNYINFVDSGMLRAFCLDNVGKESTIMFAIADWWVTDMVSFINHVPAMLYIEAVEESSVFQIKKDDLENLYLNVPKFERFFRIIMQNAYIREQLRVIENLSLSAEERYKNFLTKYPQVARQVFQKQIASYLGVTPEFLSIIRSKI